jgi:hypothetical protein
MGYFSLMKNTHSIYPLQDIADSEKRDTSVRNTKKLSLFIFGITCKGVAVKGTPFLF